MKKPKLKKTPKPTSRVKSQFDLSPPKTGPSSTLGSPQGPPSSLSAERLGARQKIATDLIDPSPFNPRNDAEIDSPDVIELADSIAQQGIVTPLIGRPSPTEPGRIELIAGERRYLAATRLKLAEVPMCLGDFSDADAHEIQAIENLQRKDLNLLQEAIGYQQMLSLRDPVEPVASDSEPPSPPRSGRGAGGEVSVPRYTIETLSARLGMPVTTIYGRVKLLKAPEIAKRAYSSGELSASVLLLLARIPDPKQAEKATWEVLDKWKSAKTEAELLSPERDRMSYRKAKDHIQCCYMIRLKGAPFDPEDEELLPVTWQVSDGSESVLIHSTEQPILPASSVTDIRVVTGNEVDGYTVKNRFYVIEHQDLPHDNVHMLGKKPRLLGPVAEKEAKTYAAFLKSATRNTQHALTITRLCGGACSACPFRTGNLQKLVPDIFDAADGAANSTDVCTMTSCFKLKKEADFKRRETKVKAEGHVLLKDTKASQIFYRDGDHYRLHGSADYIDLRAPAPVPTPPSPPRSGRGAGGEVSKSKNQNWEDLLGEHIPDQITQARDPEGKMRYLLPVAVALAAAEKAGVKVKVNTDNGNGGHSQEDYEAKRKEREEKKAFTMTIARVAFDQIQAKVLKGKPTLKLWQLIAANLWSPYKEDQRPPMKTEDQCRFAIIYAVFMTDSCDWEGEWNADFLQICKFYAIDLKALTKAKLKEAKAEATSEAKENLEDDRPGTGDDE